MSVALVWLTLVSMPALDGLASDHRLPKDRTANLWAPSENDDGDLPEDPRTSACATPSSPGVPPATVGVRVLAPASVRAGEIVSCRIRVYNRGPVPVYHVEVRNRISTPVEILASRPQAEHHQAQLVWRLAQLQPGEVRELSLDFRPTSDGPVRQCVRVRYEHGVCVETQVQPALKPPAQPALELDKEGPTQVLAGSTLVMRLFVRNRGHVPADDVVVIDDLPEGLVHAEGGQRLSFFLGRLAPGAQRVVQYHVVARQPGLWTNHARVTARGGLQAFASLTVTVSQPRLALHIEAPAQAYTGASVPVRITLTNVSDISLSQLSVEYRIPGGASVVDTQPRAHTIPGAVSWKIDRLTPEAKTTLSLELRLGQPGMLEHAVTAVVGDKRFSAQARTQVVGAAGLLLVTVDSDDPVLVGQDTRYHLIVRNQGSAPATNIRLRAVVPDEFAVTRVQGPSDHKRQGQMLLFEPLHLPPNTDRIYRIYVRALKPGVVRLRVEMTADQLPAGPVRAEESTTILNGSQF